MGNEFWITIRVLQLFTDHHKSKKMKLSLDALKESAEAVASNNLLANISGTTNDACHIKTDGLTISYSYKTINRSSITHGYIQKTQGGKSSASLLM